MSQKIYNFIIKGNPSNPVGNPVPYTRALNHSMRAADRRYFAWHEHVRAAVKDHCVPIPEDYEIIKKGTLYLYYPFNLDRKTARVDMKIYWHDKRHGDADNVFKGILDALFLNDKNVVAGSFQSFWSKNGKGRVEVEIKIAPRSN